jgi:hypothetical protein
VADSNTTRDVSLGCGSLFLIALIVWFFSGPGKGLEQEVKALRAEVGELKALIRVQTDEIRLLRDARP